LFLFIFAPFLFKPPVLVDAEWLDWNPQRRRLATYGCVVLPCTIRLIRHYE
jgi:hypothetical protein